MTERKSITVSAIQMIVTEDIDLNKRTIIANIKKAQKIKADFFLTPEGSLSGYTHKFNQKKVEDAIDEIVYFASSAGLILLLGTCFFQNKNICYNQIRIYDRKGKFVGFYAKKFLADKINTTNKWESKYYTPGSFKVFKLEDITFGLLICNDLWTNPEWTSIPVINLVQKCKEMKAKIIFHAVNSGFIIKPSDIRYRRYHHSNLQIRASASKIPIVTVNASSKKFSVNCCSGIIDSDGNWLIKVPSKKEHFFYYNLKI